MTLQLRRARRAALLVGAGLFAGVLAVGPGTPAHAQLPPSVFPASRSCPPSGVALGFSDALDKRDVDGVRVGGLSSLAYDPQRRAWASTVDNHASDPARIWFFTSLTSPRVLGSPLVLRRPDGTAYDGTTADDEGLAVLPDGRFVVSSETEPSIRVFGRDGVQQSSLPVPARFAVTGTTPAGEATANATLEGLTITPDGRHIIAAMEGALSGDVAASGDATWHRFLVYRQGRHGWTLQRQLAYRTEPGQRVAEVAAVGESDLVVLEAAFDPATGNAAQLFLVRGHDRAPDVTEVDDLSSADPSVAADKRLLTDLVECPTLGATSKQPQTNPLLDNYEGMAVTGDLRWRGNRLVGISLISDDNFGATQTTRVLNLAVAVRGPRGR
jgi:hypothetical protein